MKNVWKEKTLKSILKLEYGKPLEANERKFDGLYPVYGANGEKTRTNKYYYDRPSIIIGRKGSAGEINLTEEKFWPLDVTYFVTFDENQYDLIFLYYLLSSLDIPKLAKGVKPGINRNDIYAKQVKIPSIQEQKRIVSILEESFKAINIAKANTEKNRQNSQDLFESRLSAIFSKPKEDWSKKPLKKVLSLEYGKPLDRKDRKINGLYPAYGANGEKCRTDSFYFDKPSIIVGRKGSAGELNFTEEKFWPLDVTYFVKYDETHFDLHFIYYILKYLNLKNLAKGVKPGLNRNDVYSIMVYVPSLSIQKQIATSVDKFIDATHQLESIYQKKLIDLEELKQSLLHQAFRGGL